MSPDTPIERPSPSALAQLPVFGVWGLGGSGKTRLVEQVLPPLIGEGVRVGVVKHAGEVHLDTPGKDSDRLFAAGAEVLVIAGGEQLRRVQTPDELDWVRAAGTLAQTCDLVLVEGYKTSPLPKVWLLPKGESAPPEGIENVRAVLAWDADRPAALLDILRDFTRERWLAAPLYGLVLIGGKSRRMGTPKHLLTTGGRTWLARTAELLAPLCERVMVAGVGRMPDDADGLVRLADVPDAAGPMAGLLAAMRWGPRACWLVAACDLPALSAGALDWLTATRAVGVWATLPRLAGSDHVEPLLALYDFRARRPLEEMARAGDFRLNDLVRCGRVISPTPPEELARAWRNVNMPEELG